MTLEGKVAIVTGSGRNIGRATALELARRGASVVVNARSNRAEAESVAAEIEALGGNAIVAIADVGVKEQVNAMVDAAIAAFGRVDILVNNAGLRAADSITEMTLEQWRAVMAVNLDGPFFASQAVIPGMIERGWGRIINVSGLNAFKGRADWAHVCASKMGALGLTRALAEELAAHNILVNHIVPGAFDTSPPPGSRNPWMTISNERLGDRSTTSRSCCNISPSPKRLMSSIAISSLPNQSVAPRSVLSPSDGCRAVSKVPKVSTSDRSAEKRSRALPSPSSSTRLVMKK